jgi:hypothetical protein
VATLKRKAAAGDAIARKELDEASAWCRAEQEMAATGGPAAFHFLSAREARGRAPMARTLAVKIADGRLTVGAALELLRATPARIGEELPSPTGDHRT